MAAAHVAIQHEDFDLAKECAALRAGDARVGAVCSFVGTVRGAHGVTAMELEHYPGMTEKAIEAMVVEAYRRGELRQVGQDRLAQVNVGGRRPGMRDIGNHHDRHQGERSRQCQGESARASQRPRRRNARFTAENIPTPRRVVRSAEATSRAVSSTSS